MSNAANPAPAAGAAPEATAVFRKVSLRLLPRLSERHGSQGRPDQRHPQYHAVILPNTGDNSGDIR